MAVHRPRVDRWRGKPARRWRGRTVDDGPGFEVFFLEPVYGFATWRLVDFFHMRRRIGRFRDLLAAEPPVICIRVVLPVIEAPIRRGFSLSHTPMLTPSCKAVTNQALSRLCDGSKCWCIKVFR